MGGVDRVESLGRAEDCQFSFWRRRLDMPANDGLLHCFSFPAAVFGLASGQNHALLSWSILWRLKDLLRYLSGAFFGVHKIPCVTLLKHLALTSTKHHAFLLV